MAKAKSGAKKATPVPKKKAKPAKGSALKGATRALAKAAVKLVKGAAKATPDKAAKAPSKPAALKLPARKGDKAAGGKAAAPAPEREKKEKKGKSGAEGVPKAPPVMKVPPGVVPPDKPHPRATKLPPPGDPLTKREMEQLLTAGEGRGVVGEGSLKGRLVTLNGFPYLVVTGRDKRELTFLLQGPDQEVLPAYVDHKVSVSGLIKKLTNHGGTIDIRKYSAKKPEAEGAAPPAAPPESRLRYLSPGEVAQVMNAGMGAGMKGFASLRGNLEMTGEEFVLVVSHAGTRQQVSFSLQGKGAKGLRKHVGQTLVATGIVDKTSGWGGSLDVESFEPRANEAKAISRDNMEIAHVEGAGSQESVDVRLNHGLTVRLQEKAGHMWAIEPTAAKRVGLREANFEPSQAGAATREFFFTPRNPGTFEVEFFLAKAFTPAQVAKSFKLLVNVKQ